MLLTKARTSLYEGLDSGVETPVHVLKSKTGGLHGLASCGGVKGLVACLSGAAALVLSLECAEAMWVSQIPLSSAIGIVRQKDPSVTAVIICDHAGGNMVIPVDRSV